MQQAIAFDYELFVSFAPADEPWVQGFLLPALGLPAAQVITPQRFNLGAPRISELERAIVRSRRTLLIFSPDYLSDEYSTFGEQLISDVAVLAQTSQLLPIKLRPCTLPLRIGFRVVLDCTAEADWPAAVERLRTVLEQPEPQPEQIACPYPGMRTFEQTQAQWFYGRDAEIDALEQRLRLQRLVFVIGPSGSGKSSLIFAGLLPRLERSRLFAADFWRVRQMRPGAEPTRALVALLAGDLSQQAELIATALAAPPPAQRLLIVVDQFEDVFTQASQEEQQRFMAALEALHSLERCALVITMRADFYHSLMLSSLWSLAAGQRIEVTPLAGATLREAITEPAAQVGVYLEPVLLNQLLNDAQSEPGVLPLLQETMQLLWARRQHRLLTLSAYEQLGQDGSSGLAVALARRADAIYAGLSAEQQPIARRILVDLVNIAEGCPDTRRQLPVAALRNLSDDPAVFERTLETLTRERLLIRSSDAHNQPLVDLAHDILITAWPQFQGWLKDTQSREVELLTRQLKQAAAQWIAGARDESFLYSGARYARACELAELYRAELDQPVAEFLDACAAREQLRLRARYFGQAAGGALGTALGFGVVFGLSFAADDLAHTATIDVQVLIVALLSPLPIGACVGFAVGLALWRWRERPRQRIVASGLSGALSGGLAYGLYRLLTDPPSLFRPQALLGGALLGAGIGVAAGLADSRQRRWIMPLAGALTALLALPLEGLPIMLAPVAGLALGGLTWLGFQATAVDERERIVI